MSRIGGIIAVVAGLFSIVPGIVSLFFGGVESVYDSIGVEWVPVELESDDDTSKEAADIVEFGSLQTRWLTIIASLLIIVLGAVSAVAKRVLVPGLLLIGFSVVGIIFGTSLVVVAMGVATVGGVLIVTAGLVDKAA